MKAFLAAIGFLSLASHLALAGALALEGDYNCTGTNPDGSKYRGTTTITRISADRYSLKWSIGKQTLTGTGALAGNTLTADWGDKWPVIYKVRVDGTLEGTWSNGRATETLVPLMRAKKRVQQQARERPTQAQQHQTPDEGPRQAEALVDAGRPDVSLTEWRSAAASGDRRAMLALGRLFVKGLGAPQDYVEAHMWFNLAASRGEVAALKERDALAAKMTPEQVATAQARATAWRPAAAGTAGPEAASTAPKVAPPEEEPPAQAATAADPPPPASPPSKEAIREAQELLAALGYAPGPADGMWGKRSARAYKAFLKDAALPTAEVLSAEALQTMRDKANRQRESKEATASAGTPGATSQALVSSPTPTRSTGEVVAAITELAIQGMQAYLLVKLMEDPKNIARVAPELQKLLGKMVSGLSAAELSNKENAQVSLGALTVAERGRLSDLLKKDEGLPKQTREALSGALRAKGAAPTVASGPKCAGAAEGAQCWKDVANKPGCRVWDDYYVPDQTVTWSGTCSGGVVAGKGTLTWRTSEDSHTTKGTISSGRMDGRWVVRFAEGGGAEGPYVNGKKHGKWVLRYAKGEVHEGPYVDGKRQGRWAVRRSWTRAGRSFVSESEGPYVDGKRQGRWVKRSYRVGDSASGWQYEGPYKDGKRHGQWVHRTYGKRPGSVVHEGPYKDGKKHGRWVHRTYGKSLQTVYEGPYKDGKRHGQWVMRSSDGWVQEIPYVEGKRHGRSFNRGPDGFVEETPYVEGKRHGLEVRREPDGTVWEQTYERDKLIRWIIRKPDGTVVRRK